jgi:hypothetical protein
LSCSKPPIRSDSGWGSLGRWSVWCVVLRSPIELPTEGKPLDEREDHLEFLRMAEVTATTSAYTKCEDWIDNSYIAILRRAHAVPRRCRGAIRGCNTCHAHVTWTCCPTVSSVPTTWTMSNENDFEPGDAISLFYVYVSDTR